MAIQLEKDTGAEAVSPQQKIDNLRRKITIASDVYQRYVAWRNGLRTFVSTIGSAAIVGGAPLVADKLNLIHLSSEHIPVVTILMGLSALTGYYVADNRAVNGAIDQVAETRQLPRIKVRDTFRNYALKKFPVDLS